MHVTADHVPEGTTGIIFVVAVAGPLKAIQCSPDSLCGSTHGSSLSIALKTLRGKGRTGRPKTNCLVKLLSQGKAQRPQKIRSVAFDFEPSAARTMVL